MNARGLFAHLVLAPEKPVFRQPCNGCGQCCLASRCDAAEILFGISDDICPALRWDGCQYRCEVMERPLDYLNPNAGCDDLTELNEFSFYVLSGGKNRSCGCPDDSIGSALAAAWERATT